MKRRRSPGSQASRKATCGKSVCVCLAHPSCPSDLCPLPPYLPLSAAAVVDNPTGSFASLFLVNTHSTACTLSSALKCTGRQCRCLHTAEQRTSRTSSSRKTDTLHPSQPPSSCPLPRSIRGIVQWGAFCGWLVSLSVMSSRFIHAVACVRMSFL